MQKVDLTLYGHLHIVKD